MRKIWKIICAVCALVCAVGLGVAAWGVRSLPDSYYTVDGFLPVHGVFTATAPEAALNAYSGIVTENEQNLEYELKILDVIPVKTVNVRVAGRKYLAVGGELVGVKLRTKGLLVVGTEAFTADDGKNTDPAAEAGIRKGDTLLSVNGMPLENNETLTTAIERSGGQPLSVTLRRGDQLKTVALAPRKTAATGLYKGGLWVRDSTVGVGTLSFCDIENGKLAALGHGVYDTDTASLLEVSGGEICAATVSSVKKGAVGAPGEITGTLGMNTLGSITVNTEDGVFGDLYYMENTPEIYPAATASEVHTGEAQVICTVTEGAKQAYEVEILKVNDADDVRNMVVKVTDETLLSITGGIVQGMSGSPLVQDGMLVGAITHVFVNDPKCGYAIYTQNMLERTD